MPVAAALSSLRAIARDDRGRPGEATVPLRGSPLLRHIATKLLDCQVAVTLGHYARNTQLGPIEKDAAVGFDIKTPFRV